MTFASITGQLDVKKRLGSALMGVPGHAYVFMGPSGSGKKMMAKAFAAALLCQQPSQQGACGHCSSCHHFGNGVHPDYIDVSCEPKEKLIKVETVRKKVCADIAMHPQFGDRKVYQIDADALNEQGQNALLKSLEEPPAYVFYLLTVSNQERLLRTVRSRITPIVMQRLSVSEIRDVLRGYQVEDEALTTFYARFSGGLAGAAINLATNEWFTALRQETIALYQSLASATRAQLLTTGYQFFDQNKEQTDLILEILGSLIRDQLVLLTDRNNHHLTNEDQRQMFSRQPIMSKDNAAARHNLNQAYQALLLAQRGLVANASFEGLACQLLLAIRKELSHA